MGEIKGGMSQNFKQKHNFIYRNILGTDLEPRILILRDLLVFGTYGSLVLLDTVTDGFCELSSVIYACLL